MQDRKPSPWPGRRGREKAREAKREAVLLTAVKFFNLKGFTSTSLDDVALDLGVTKPTIYHYFSSKDDILFECLRQGLQAIRAAAEAAAAHGDSGIERLRQLLVAYGTTMTEDFGICVSRTADEQLTPQSRAKFRAMKREIDTTLRRLIAEGMADGSIATADPRLLGFTLAGAMNSIARWYDPGGAVPAKGIVEQTVEILIAGLAPRGKT